MEKENPNSNLSEPLQVVSPERVRNLVEPSLEPNVVTGTTEKQNQAGSVQENIDLIDMYIARREIDPDAVINTPSLAINEYLCILNDLSSESKHDGFNTKVVDEWFRDVHSQWALEISKYEVPPTQSELTAVVTHMKRYLESLTNQNVSPREGIELLLDAYCCDDSVDMMYSLGQAMGFKDSDWTQFISQALEEAHVSLQVDSINESTYELERLSKLSELVGLGPISSQ